MTEAPKLDDAAPPLGPSPVPDLALRICALLSDPEAPYDYRLDVAPGTVYEGGGVPWPDLTVVSAEATPIREVLYQRQTVEVEARPGEPVRLCVSRMVGRLDDGREVPLGEVWAVPEAVLQAADRGLDRCAACGVALRPSDVVELDGALYHRGCVG